VGRIYPIDSDVRTLFVDNGKFDMRRSEYIGERLVVADGVEHVQPSINFPELRDTGEFRAKGNYRTIFGPAVYLPVSVIATNDYNQSFGLLRILNVPKLCPRVKETLQPDEYLQAMRQQYVELRENQANATVLRGNLLLVAQRFLEALQDYEGVEDEIEWRVHLPHQKRELRELGFKEIGNDGIKGDRKKWHRKTWYKCKTDELAKFGKIIRMIGDLGVNASLAGFIITELLKTSLCEPLYFRNAAGEVTLKVVFTKQPTVENMQACFDDMLQPSCDRVFYYHSDDSILAIKTADGVRRYNIDISSCDASHTLALFQLLSEVTPPEFRDEIDVLIDQCKQVFEVRSYVSPARTKLKPREPVLPSGSTLTTLINNLACLVAANQMAMMEVNTEVEIREAWRQAGYIVTLDPADTFERVQFLKTSPCEDVNGVYRPLLNLGVFLRSSGRCKGDLPGSGDINERAKEFQGSLIQSMYPNTRIPMVDDLRSRFPLKKRYDHEMSHKFSDTVGFTFSNAAVFRRYNIQGTELEEWFQRADTETYADSAEIRRVLEVDYEYKYD